MITCPGNEEVGSKQEKETPVDPAAAPDHAANDGVADDRQEKEEAPTTPETAPDIAPANEETDGVHDPVADNADPENDSMQSWNGCAGLTGDATLIDTRDCNTYRVRKLADDKCWMIDNLRLGDSKLANRTLTSTNTDLNGTLKTYKLSDIGQTKYVYVVEADSEDGKELKAYGGYYNYDTATVGTGQKTSSGKDAPSSICPKGWKLPTGYDYRYSTKAGDLHALGGILGDNADVWTGPDGPNFLLGGQYYGGALKGQGSTGEYWTSMMYSSNEAYILLLQNGTAYYDAGTKTYSTNGNILLNVRCLKR